MLSRASFHTCLPHHFTVHSIERGFLSATPSVTTIRLSHRMSGPRIKWWKQNITGENDQSIISEPSTTTNMDSAQKQRVPVCNSIHTKNGFLTWEPQPGWCSRASFRLKSINQFYALQSIIPHMSLTPFHSPLHIKGVPVCNSILDNNLTF